MRFPPFVKLFIFPPESRILGGGACENFRKSAHPPSKLLILGKLAIITKV